jgi:hypothetical protein
MKLRSSMTTCKNSMLDSTAQVTVSPSLFAPHLTWRSYANEYFEQAPIALFSLRYSHLNMVNSILTLYSENPLLCSSIQRRCLESACRTT